MSQAQKFDFSSILNQQIGSAQAPQPLPSGTYHGTIDGMPTTRVANTKEGSKGILAININLTEADSDVDETELALAGGLLRNDGKPKNVRAEFWLTEDALYIFDNFLSGFKLEGNRQEALPELTGRDVTVALERRNYTDKNDVERTVTDVRRVFAR